VRSAFEFDGSGGKAARLEGSLQILRSLGFRAERLQANHPVADKS
jgi:hypothetical protein